MRWIACYCAGRPHEYGVTRDMPRLRDAAPASHAAAGVPHVRAREARVTPAGLSVLAADPCARIPGRAFVPRVR